MNTDKIVFFDGVCNLCNTTIQFLIAKNDKKSLRFSSLQSNFAQQFLKDRNLKPTNFESIYYLKDDKLYSHSGAMLEIVKELKGFYPYFNVLKIIPKPIRDYIYKWISKNRYRWFGKKEVCWMPTPDLKDRFID